MIQDHELRFVIIDNGSGFCKAGFAGDDFPVAIFPSVVSRPVELHESQRNKNCEEVCVGNAAKMKREGQQVSFAIVQGIITNWDDMEKIWQHAFYNELKVAPEEHPVLLTEPPLNPKSNRERMTRIMFETFNVPAILISVQAALVRWAHGWNSSLVVESGDGITHTVPLYEGYILPHAITRVEIAGKELTAYLANLLAARGNSSQRNLDVEIASEIKERFCFVSTEYELELVLFSESRVFERDFELPNGDVISIGNERFRCPEALFNPALLGKEAPGLHQAIHQSLMNCSIEARELVCRGILLSGGNTMFPGILERLEKELKILQPELKHLKVFAANERKYSAWIGGSVVASLDTFKTSWITVKEYDRFGPSIIHSKQEF